MSGRRILGLLLCVALLGAYGYRAVIGIRAGRAWDKGIHKMLSRSYTAAYTAFGEAAVGLQRYDMQRRSGDARIDVWENKSKRGGPKRADPTLLQEAAQDYMNALCSAPAARHPWLGLALVYQKLEWVGRERRTEHDFVSGVEPWSRVGRSGRIAVGFGREAVAASANWYLTHDWMARTLWLFGLDAESRDSIRQSARALPLYYRHEFRGGNGLPEWAPELFFEASRELVGRTPLLPRANHLVDLGKQARGLGRNEDAVESLTEALSVARNPLILAEARFHLGIAMVQLGRETEGWEHLALAAEHPVFREPALNYLARSAETAGDHTGAQNYLRALRREYPRNVDYCLRSARLARATGDWPVAIEALQWAKIVEPSDERAYVASIETYLEMGDLPSARAALRKLQELDAEAVPEGIRRRMAED